MRRDLSWKTLQVVVRAEPVKHRPSWRRNKHDELALTLGHPLVYSGHQRIDRTVHNRREKLNNCRLVDHAPSPRPNSASLNTPARQRYSRSATCSFAERRRLMERPGGRTSLRLVYCAV